MPRPAGLPGRDVVVEDGAVALPASGQGVAVGDPAGELPVSPDLKTFDYYEMHPARGAIVRVHVEWRRELYNPHDLPEGVALTDLQDVRVTQKEYVDGTYDVEEDKWENKPNQPRKALTRRSAGAWRGTTWFFLKGARVLPGPVRRRTTGKKAPLFVTEEWELLKKLKTSPEYKRSNLVDSLSVQGIERSQLVAAQRVCPDLRAFYLGKLAEDLGKDARESLVQVQKEDKDAFQNKKLDAVVRQLEHFELVNQVLFRRVYNSVSNQVELRCAVPSGKASTFDFPGRGTTPLGFRERILLEYHNGRLGGHQGRERTVESISRDFWWPGLYGDVRRWCSKCEFCRAERGSSGLAAWTRTELYSCPFRVMQFDHITCGTDKYVLTCVCCFSRWVWLKPVADKGAEMTAKTLLAIFCDMGSFPTVLRSDNAAEFISDVVKSMNAMLEIKHITGSAYHPQSQGQVESMHKTLNLLVRALVDGHPEKWEETLVYAQMLLRSAPMACLGGRSPYEVVTGLKPRLPRTALGALPVELRTVNSYVNDLMTHLREVHATVQRVALEEIEKTETTLGGHISAELEVGDPVLVRREATVRREGPTRFQSRVYEGVYKVLKKISPTTYTVGDLNDAEYVPPFKQPLHAERLIKLDMPELELQPGQPRKLELRENPLQPWNTYVIDRFGTDERVRLELEGGAAQTKKWVVLTQCEYRWLA